MADKSAIEWTNSTWNPVTGCTKISSGCDHCYAERFSERFRGVAGHPFETGFDLTLRPDRIDQPKRWRRPRLIFVNSMSDLFHKNIPTDYVNRVFDTMETADWHVFQVLTKRSSLMQKFVNRRYPGRLGPSHIWLGVSIENAAAMSRLQHLKQTNAFVRFVSFEPLLGPLGAVDLNGIHWVIAGGESGPGARPIDIRWLREIRDCCQDQQAAFFFKQWGGRTPKTGGNMLDGRQWLEYPDTSVRRQTGQPLQAAGSPPDDSKSAAPMEVGPWAEEKLECLRKYLHAYTTILRKQQQFKGYFYIDAFAGPGLLKIRQSQRTDPEQRARLFEVSAYALKDPDHAEYISGSPRVALELDHPFTDYIFIELDTEYFRHLQLLKHKFETIHPNVRIHVKNQDCNNYLIGFLERNRDKWERWRGIVFLDPFGMQVPWSTLAKLAQTEAIEVLINFPVATAVQRLLKRSGQFSEREREKLDNYFGTDQWFNPLYEKKQALFGGRVFKVGPSGDLLVKWYRERLKGLFKYVTAAREVQSTTGRPLYYLIFAGPNRTGARIASDVLKQGARIVR